MGTTVVEAQPAGGGQVQLQQVHGGRPGPGVLHDAAGAPAPDGWKVGLPSHPVCFPRAVPVGAGCS